MDNNAILELLEVVPGVPIFLCDSGGKILTCNEAAISLLPQNEKDLNFFDVFESLNNSEITFFELVNCAADAEQICLKGTRNCSFALRARTVGTGSKKYALSLTEPVPTTNPSLYLETAEEVSQLGCFNWDIAADTLTWSDGLLRIFGIDSSQFSQNSGAFFERVHPDDRTKIQAALHRAAQNGGDYECSERIIRPNGETRWIESKGKLNLDEAGRPKQLFGICQDTTNRVLDEAQLRKQIDALELLTECASALFSPSLPESGWTPLLERLASVAGADMFVHLVRREGVLTFALAGGLPDLLVDQLREAKDLSQSVCGRCEESTHESHLTSQDLLADSPGQQLYEFGMRSYFAIPLTEDGQSIGTLTFASTEKSEFSEEDRRFLRLVSRVVSAARARKVVDQLREQEHAKYQRAAQHARMVVWEGDPQTCDFKYVSDYCETLSGYSAEEWYEPNFRISRIHSDDRETSAEFCRKEISQKRDHELEYRMVRKDGEVIWIHENVEVVVEDGKVSDLRGTLVDITQRKLLEQQLLQAQKMEAIGSMASGIAHDFNNLLTVVLTSCELLLHPKHELSAYSREVVQSIQDAGARANRLTDQLLLFSRSSPRQHANVDINLVIPEIGQLLDRLLGDQIQVSISVEKDLPRIQIAPTHLEQTLINLAVNARDAMPEGGRLELNASAMQPPHDASPVVASRNAAGFVVITVKDEGTGIPDSVRSRVFDPFFTTKPPGSGTGLGLSVVYGIVHGAGGHIDFESKKDQGTEFRVYLPISDEQLETAADAPVIEVTSGTETILVVEDEAAVNKILVETFRQAGYEVVGFLNASEALEFVRNSNLCLDMLVTDVSMPAMTGPELACEVRALDKYEMLPVLFLSGNDQHILEKHGIKTDAQNFIQKPFQIANLVGRVRTLLANVQSNANETIDQK